MVGPIHGAGYGDSEIFTRVHVVENSSVEGIEMDHGGSACDGHDVALLSIKQHTPLD